MSEPSGPLPAAISEINKEKKPPESFRKPRFDRLRRWMRSRNGRIVIPLIALVLGIIIGIASLLLYGISGQGKVLPVPGPGRTDISVVADKNYITSIVSMNLRESGLPGSIENVQVDLASGDQFTIKADDAFSVLGIGFTRHFTVVVQPYIGNCSLQVHVISADLSSIPVTGFVAAFESSINAELQQQPTGMPQGFQYCATSVSTQPAGMLLTYSAIPA
jgi:hypothetical protein